MNSKVLTAVAAVIIIVIAAAAVYVVFGGDDANDGSDGAPVLKDTFEPGDYYTTTSVISAVGMTETEVTTYTITGVSDSGYTVTETTNGIAYELGTMSRETFLSNTALTEENLTQVSKTGSETISTDFGNLKCDVYEGTVTGVTVKLWVCPDNNIVFRTEGSGDVFGVTASVVVTLTAATIFEDASDTPSGTDTLTIRKEFRAGDVLSISVWNTSVIGLESETIFGTESYTVIEDLGNDQFTVTFAMDGDTPSERIMTNDQLLQAIIPDTSGMTLTPAGQEVLDTPWGNVVCDVFTHQADNEGGFDKAPTGKYWFDAENGIMLKYVISADDVTASDGTHYDHWELGLSLQVATVIS